ncbi:bacteriohemerythrin [Phaeospirillum tilakii]|uniref:Bacteriohemerythrin n=1 Tax=Phaeospirillum tilakii TaxID=741673 RepID=A0ABW5C840_9PROT
MSLHWNEMMSVGVPSLDADHRFLITLINHLNRAIGDVEEYLAVASVLRGVEDYAAVHFAREERLMLACGFPQFARHRQTHQGFITSLAALRHRYDQDRAGARDSLGFLNRWLIDHICSSDMGYRSWLVLQDAALAAVGPEPLFAPPGPEADWRQLTLLLAEDNLTLREILLTFLQGAGVRGDRVMMVAHADAARRALASGRVDLMLCDDDFEGGGLALIEHSRRAGLALPMVLLTTGGPDRRTAARAVGADATLDKPVSAAALVATLAALTAGLSLRG